MSEVVATFFWQVKYLVTTLTMFKEISGHLNVGNNEQYLCCSKKCSCTHREILQAHTGNCWFFDAIIKINYTCGKRNIVTPPPIDHLLGMQSFISLNNFTFIIYVKFHEKIMILFRYLIRSTKIETNKIIFIILPENLLLESLAKLYQHVQYDLKRKCFVLHFSFNKP